MLAPPQAPQCSCWREAWNSGLQLFLQLPLLPRPSTLILTTTLNLPPPPRSRAFFHPCRQPPSIPSKTHDGAAQAFSAPAVKMATTSNMFMYSLTIQPPSTVTQAIVGQFSGTKEQQIMTACGTRLSLLKPDPTQGKVITILSHDVFGIIRSIAAFRLAGSNKGKLPSHLRIPPS